MVDPNYFAESFPDGDWRRIDRVLRAPVGAVSARLQLGFRWAAAGTVKWDDVRLSRIDAPAARMVRVATVYNRPSGLTQAGNADSFAAAIDRAAAYGPDIICLPEATNSIGTGLSFPAAGELIPGGTSFQRLSDRARQHSVYIVAGLIERDGAVIYNTSVLINRAGQLAGKYRKVYLPINEVEGGMTPGSEYPVFDTEFGRIGMMICWDMQFTDAARALTAKGAEVILMPIWGGNDLLTRARAAENYLTLVTSSYDSPTGIINQDGNYIVQTTSTNYTAVADINLDQFDTPNPRSLFYHERRGDLSLEP